MKPKDAPRFQPHVLTSLILVISLQITICFCQDISQYQACIEKFECGSLGEIFYPFWGGGRPAFCGHPNFHLEGCQLNFPTLFIGSTLYRVLGVDYTLQTLTVARDDLSDSLCPTPTLVLNDAVIDYPFTYSSTANDQSITLFYGCNISDSQQSRILPRGGRFNCRVNETDSLNVYTMTMRNETIEPPSCNNNISVPVNQIVAEDLSFKTSNSLNASIDVLKTALRLGFSIGWWTEDEGLCKYCQLSGGSCGSYYLYWYGSMQQEFTCYCIDGSSNRTCPHTPFQTGAGICISGLVIASGIIFYITKPRRSWSWDLEINQNIDKFILNHGSLALKRYSYSDIKKITKSFSDKLGQGGYGIVYKGNLPHGQPVAVKLLTETNDNGEEFINEVASISRTSHVNIVNLLGYCYERKRRALIYEFMPNKSLDKFINNGSHSDSHLEWEKLYEIAAGVARGLEYLHRGCNTRIVHFDIKPQNILLDEDFCPKIADFGLAKLVKKKQSMISMLGARGTVGYIAPEVFSRNFGGVSHKSDVYSYGMMLLEMAGARKVAEIEATQSSEDYFPDKIYEHVLVNNEKLDDDIMSEEKEETSRKMLLIGLWCIQTASSDRPSMTKVVEMLEGSLQSIEIPPKPSLFHSTLSVNQISSSTSVTVEIESSSQV